MAEHMSVLISLNANQVKQIAGIQHKHLVRLIGFCEEKHQQLLVYDYLQNGNVGNHLYGNPSHDFSLHMCICVTLLLCTYGNKYHHVYLYKLTALLQIVKVYQLES